MKQFAIKLVTWHLSNIWLHRFSQSFLSNISKWQCICLVYRMRNTQVELILSCVEALLWWNVWCTFNTVILQNEKYSKIRLLIYADQFFYSRYLLTHINSPFLYLINPTTVRTFLHHYLFTTDHVNYHQ